MESKLKTSFNKLKIEVFKLNDRAHLLDSMAVAPLSKKFDQTELFELLMNDVLKSISYLTDSALAQSYDININQFINNLSKENLSDKIQSEYQTILNICRSLCKKDLTELIKYDLPKREQTIHQALEAAGHLKKFTDLLQSYIKYD
ncbi:MAG: hypothetical protein JXR46_03185 [Calditrichaceae bacterium]|nr:hypothetical protein [Calditrichaceae bacterium]MBN2708029.1 hypothetical protein [Calditrichaceae bacterium]RQV93970.1 MAG: hypothetical protein EH224_11485 [Calditrichota bacterium]